MVFTQTPFLPHFAQGDGGCGLSDRTVNSSHTGKVVDGFP